MLGTLPFVSTRGGFPPASPRCENGVVSVTIQGLGRTRTRVLSVLHDAGMPLSVNELSDLLDMHPNSVRFHLEHLVEGGLVEASSRPNAGKGRPPAVYGIAADAPPLTNRHLLELTSALLTHFVPRGESTRPLAIAAGRDWAARTTADDDEPSDDEIESLIENLGVRGFTTERTATGLAFTRCPFWDVLSPEELHTVCAIHQGFVEGFLEQAGGAVSPGDIQYDVRPCVVDLHRRGEVPAPASQSLTGVF
jgi:predicted ArsR family transcriptional regulator